MTARSGRKDAHQSFVKADVYDRDHSQKRHVHKTRDPHRTLSALGLSCAQILPDERGRCVGQTPGRHQGEHEDANRNRVAGQCFAPECGNDAHQSDPRGGRNDKFSMPPSDVRTRRLITSACRRICEGNARMCFVPRNKSHSCVHTPSPRPTFVATPAPSIPMAGKGPQPKMSMGSRTMFTPLDSHKTRMATATPAAEGHRRCRGRISQ